MKDTRSNGDNIAGRHGYGLVIQSAITAALEQLKYLFGLWMAVARIGLACLYSGTSYGKAFGVAEWFACHPAQSPPILGDNLMLVGSAQDLLQLDRGSRIPRHFESNRIGLTACTTGPKY